MIVSISRDLGAGGLSVGEAVAKRLNATLLNERRIIEILSERMQLPHAYLEDIDERAPRLSESLLANVAYASAMVIAPAWRGTDEDVIDAVRALVIEEAAKGDVVLIGHGGPGLMRSIDASIPRFTVLLYAGAEWRVAQVAKRFGLSSEEARRRVARVDEARAKYLQHYYRSESHNAREYDLAVNTERTGIDGAIELVSAACKL